MTLQQAIENEETPENQQQSKTGFHRRQIIHYIINEINMITIILTSGGDEAVHSEDDMMSEDPNVDVGRSNNFFSNIPCKSTLLATEEDDEEEEAIILEDLLFFFGVIRADEEVVGDDRIVETLLPDGTDEKKFGNSFRSKLPISLTSNSSIGRPRQRSVNCKEFFPTLQHNFLTFKILLSMHF